MAKGPMYVKDFDFSSAGKTVGYCGGGMVKTKMANGGSAKAGQNVQMAKSNAIEKSMSGQKMTKMASGGYYAEGGSITEEATGETYPSRSAMVKHEALETPRMQKQEMIQKSTVRAPALKLKAGRASAGKAAIPPQITMKTGGFVEGGGMIPNKGSLGVKNNKDPGESGGKALVKSHPAYNFKKGGEVKKYAMGGPTASQQGALQAMKAAASKQAPQQRMPPQESPMRAPPRGMEQMAAQMAQRGPSPQQMASGAGGRSLPPQEAPMRAPPRGMATGLKKGGTVPKTGQYKIPKVMDEFKSGKLHSGSKSGPEVTNRKQALAIAISEARNAAKKK